MSKRACGTGSLYVRTDGAGRGSWGGGGECEAGWIRPPRLGAMAMMRSPTITPRSALVGRRRREPPSPLDQEDDRP